MRLIMNVCCFWYLANREERKKLEEHDENNNWSFLALPREKKSLEKLSLQATPKYSLNGTFVYKKMCCSMITRVHHTNWGIIQSLIAFLASNASSDFFDELGEKVFARVAHKWVWCK